MHKGFADLSLTTWVRRQSDCTFIITKGRKSEVSKLDKSCTSNPKFRDFGFEMQDSSNFEISLLSQKDRVMWAALLQTAPYALHFSTEAVIAQALLEFSIFPGRPDGEHAVAL